MSTQDADKIRVQFSDGTVADHPPDASAMDIANGSEEGFMRSVVAAEVSGKLIDAARALGEVAQGGSPITMKLVTDRDPESLSILYRSAAHVMARAVMRLYEGVSLGPRSMKDDGFSCDFDLPDPISEGDFPKIESEMKKIISGRESFERFTVDREEAQKLCCDLGQEFKVQQIQTDLSDQSKISFYRQGEFVDLCDGPHLPDAGRIGSIRLTSISSVSSEIGGTEPPMQRLHAEASFDAGKS